VEDLRLGFDRLCAVLFCVFVLLFNNCYTSKIARLHLLQLFLCKSDHFPRRYRSKQKWVFLLKHSVDTNIPCIRVTDEMPTYIVYVQLYRINSGRDMG